ncbi:hypothetical protein F5144DRAFT_559938 [Chaetomium tenue]|uniref:Uncharacterized protein n=1 Tax=Chaetomium tenue TaxID=1854479 RepID=A0ACB7PER3_9PEZI|nr:hypothetical protein F5144DRAFT_559938 [Chaetomium globosum]
MHRYTTTLSSRRALLSTLVALNPDTFAERDSKEDRTGLSREGMAWADPILKPSGSRTAWEGAMREALNEVQAREPTAIVAEESFRAARPGPFSAQWNEKYKGGDCYWSPFMSEGIYMASKIKVEASLSGRRVSESPGLSNLQHVGKQPIEAVRETYNDVDKGPV